MLVVGIVRGAGGVVVDVIEYKSCKRTWEYSNTVEGVWSLIGEGCLFELMTILELRGTQIETGALPCMTRYHGRLVVRTFRLELLVRVWSSS